MSEILDRILGERRSVWPEGVKIDRDLCPRCAKGLGECRCTDAEIRRAASIKIMPFKGM